MYTREDFHMTDKDLWTTFEKTGSVVDYLNYKGICMKSEKQEIGERAVESVDNRDRDGAVRDTYR